MSSDTGPVVEEDPRSDEEKELDMIKGCISDYNTGRISEVEEYLNTQLHPLPLDIDSLPEIESLHDLDEEKEFYESSNVTYAGSYMVDDRYKIIFLIYEPTGSSFWLNGRILFQIDPELVVKDDPKFAEYRDAMLYLLENETDVLNWMYGLNITLAQEEGPFPGYYEVLRMGITKPSSINDIRSMAEQVFTKKYLEDNFYYSAFYSDYAMFKEADGAVYCAKSEMIAQESSMTYDPHYIINAEERDGTVYMDMLSQALGTIQPDIKRLTMEKISEGYRLPSAY